MIEIHNMQDLRTFILKKYNSGCKIFAFTGHIGTGKNYVSFEVGKQLQEYGFNVLFTSFASELKKLILKSFGFLKDGTQLIAVSKEEGKSQFVNFMVNNCLQSLVSEDVIYRISDKYMELQKLISDEKTKGTSNKLIVRKLLQVVGEYARSLDSNVWIGLVCNYIKSLYDFVDIVFVTDLRYPNEYKGLKITFNSITTIRVITPVDKVLERLGISKGEYLNLLRHPSETNIDNLTEIDAVYVNN